MLNKYFPADNEKVFPRKCKQILCVLLSQLSFHRKFPAGENQTKTKPYLYTLKKNLKKKIYIHSLLKSIRSNLISKVSKPAAKSLSEQTTDCAGHTAPQAKPRSAYLRPGQVNELLTTCTQVNPCIEIEANCKKAV